MSRIGIATRAMDRGGVETYILTLGKHLKEAGNDVEVIVTSERGVWFDEIASAGLTAVDLTKSGRRGPFRSVRLAGDVTSRKYDVLFLNHARNLQKALWLLPPSVRVVPVLHNNHSNIYDVVAICSEGWNVAVAVGQKVAERARDILPGKAIVEIPNGIEIPATRMRRTPPEGVLNLLFVGRLDEEQKGVFLIPEILRTCVSQGLRVHLDIVGEGPEGGELRKRIKGSGLEDVASFCGAEPHEKVRERMLCSHALILPSKFEGLPMVLLEAQACGCVPVCSLLPGSSDQAIEDKVTGFLAPLGDAHAFTEFLQQLQNPTVWESMSAAGMERIKGRFSSDVMGAAYAQLVRELVEDAYPLSADRKVLAINRFLQGTANG